MRKAAGIALGILAVLLLLAYALAYRLSPPDSSNDANATSTIEAGKRSISVFFLKDEAGAEDGCPVVQEIPRTISDTPSYLRSAMEALIEGPSTAEKNAGYFGPLGQKSSISSLLVQNGDVFLDLSTEPVSPDKSACYVLAVRSSIEKTLKQFPGMENVTISVKGRNDILEP